MTNRKAWALALVTSLASCACLFTAGAGPENPPAASEGTDAARGPANPMLGVFFAGETEGNPHNYTFFLESIADDTVSGYVMVNGEKHVLGGTVVYKKPAGTAKDREPELFLRETGDHAAKGTYQFHYHHAYAYLEGYWVPDADRYAFRNLNMPRFDFRYPQVSERLLGTNDVENLRAEELHRMRLELYVRHGFGERRLIQRDAHLFGGNQPGTALRGDTSSLLRLSNVPSPKKPDEPSPASSDLPGLTPIEQSNEALISNYERYYQRRDSIMSRRVIPRCPEPLEELHLRVEPLR